MNWKKTQNSIPLRNQQKRLINRFADLIQSNLKGFEKDAQKQTAKKNTVDTKKNTSVNPKLQSKGNSLKLKNYSYVPNKDKTTTNINPKNNTLQQANDSDQKGKAFIPHFYDQVITSTNQYPTFGDLLVAGGEQNQNLGLQSNIKSQRLNTAPCSHHTENPICLNKGRINIDRFFGEDQKKNNLDQLFYPPQQPKSFNNSRLLTEIQQFVQRQSIGEVILNKTFFPKNNIQFQQTKRAFQKVQPPLVTQRSISNRSNDEVKENSPRKLKINQSPKSKSIIKIGKNGSGFSPIKKKQRVDYNCSLFGSKRLSPESSNNIVKPLR